MSAPNWSAGEAVRWLALLLSLCLLLPRPAFAQAPGSATAGNAPAGTIAEESRTLDQRARQLAAQRETLDSKIDALQNREVSPAAVDEARLSVDAARVQLEAAQLDRLAAERQLNELDADIKTTEERLNTLIAGTTPPPEGQNRQQAIAALRQALEKKKKQRADQEAHVANLRRAQELARQELGQAEDWWQALRRRLQQQQEAARQEVLADLERRTQAQQQKLQDQAGELRKQLRAIPEDTPEGQARHRLLETRIKGLEESGYLLQMKLEVERARHTLAKLEEALAPATRQSQASLRATRDELGQLVDTLASVQTLARRKLELLREQLKVLARRESLRELPGERIDQERAIISDLVGRFERQLAALEPVLSLARERYGKVQELYRQSVQRGLTVRHSLLGEPSVWPDIWADLQRLPITLFRAVADSTASLYQALINGTPRTWGGLGLFVLGWTWLWWVVTRPHPEARRLEARTFVSKAGRISEELLHHNRRVVFVTVVVVVGAFILSLPPSDIALFGMLFGTWLVARVAHWSAHRLLADARVPPEQRQPTLFRWIVWTTWIGAVFAVILFIGHVGLYSVALRNFLDRLFMLFLFVPAYLGFRVRATVIRAVSTTLSRRWLQVVRLIALLIPLSILVAAALGLLGYLNLAWTVAEYLAWFLAILSGWLVLNEFLKDAAALGRESVITRSGRGPDWAQGIIDPLYQLLRLLLLLGALVVLVQIFGWGPGSVIGDTVWNVITHPLGRIGNVTIDIQHILLTAIVVALALWVGRQVRELSYRWLYGGVVDIGVRHSLAVFTQYAIVISGLLIALNLFGLNLTSLAIFAGALGVGIGFGLQSIANNLLSGIILLVERPLRTGDWVSVGPNEGEVTRIGLRSVTITTWDNQDVIIPNAEIISNAFTNWTHKDNLVRTVIHLRISYRDDPAYVSTILEQTIRQNPAVLSQPAPRVWLHELGESAFEFWVQYFTDVRKHVRLETRSEVLLAVWQRLREQNISIPYPQQEVHFRPDQSAEAAELGE